MLKPHIYEVVGKLRQHLANPKIFEVASLSFNLNPAFIAFTGVFFSAFLRTGTCNLVIDERRELTEVRLFSVAINEGLVNHSSPEFVLNFNGSLNLSF